MFCSECGSRLEPVAKFCPSCGTQRSPNIDKVEEQQEWNPFVHAYVSVFGGAFKTTDDLLLAFSRDEQAVMAAAEDGDPEALLRVSLIMFCYSEHFTNAVTVCKQALDAAMSAGIELARYLFVYGFILEETNHLDEAFDVLSQALKLGFGEAALNLGQLALARDEDLRSAFNYWRIGFDQYGSRECEAALKDVELEPGVYSVTLQQPDGSHNVITISDRPGGLGKSPRQPVQ